MELDSFQKEALKSIEADHSVLVSAPTGSGKTLIAEFVIQRALARGENIIYTAPIKALSNQKYRDFRTLYGEIVGILTGDVSLNPEAPILIMTTEIYRNSVFENSERLQKTGWVIFDEIHYLDDVERGTVWEEALLFTPAHVKILALSATVPNADQLAEWIQSVHSRPFKVITEPKRPVPLHFFFQCQGRLFQTVKDLRQHGFMNRDQWHIKHRHQRRREIFQRAKPNRLDQLMDHLVSSKRLPAIYFAFGRRRTEKLAEECNRYNLLTAEEQKNMIRLYDELLRRYDLSEDKTAREIQPLIESGIAYHHAGMLPTLKEVIEQLFTSRLIKIIFTTETFALGINMPARTVIFDELEKFYGNRFAPLTTRDFYQMAGRAGRRGMDEEGFVYMRINPHDVSLTTVERLLGGKPEPIKSQLNTAYATLLNLYRQFGPRLLEIYPKTFHHFQSHHKKRSEGYDLMQRKLTMLKELRYFDDRGLTAKGEFAAAVFGYELLTAEMHEEGVFDQLDEIHLNVMLSGFIFEPRKNDHLPRLYDSHKKLLRTAEHYAHQIHRQEAKYRISPYTKMIHFNLAPAVDAWSRGCDFDALIRHTTSDEGELVRHFRMIIQLLRELIHAPHTSDKLKQRAEKAKALINRGVVDAEKQLRT